MIDFVFYTVKTIYAVCVVICIVVAIKIILNGGIK